MSPQDKLLSAEEAVLLGRTGGAYLVTYSFEVDSWSRLLQDESLSYWRSRRFNCRCSTDGRQLYGRRGSWWGNLFCFDVSRIRSELLLEVKECVVDSRTLIDYRCQAMALWNMVDFKLEQLLFRNKLRGLPIPDGIKELETRRRRHKIDRVVGRRARAVSSFPTDLSEMMVVLADGSMPRVALASSSDANRAP